MKYDKNICAWPENVPITDLPFPVSKNAIETNILYPDRYMTQGFYDGVNFKYEFLANPFLIFFLVALLVFEIWFNGVIQGKNK